jgi:hypothetical protein
MATLAARVEAEAHPRRRISAFAQGLRKTTHRDP